MELSPELNGTELKCAGCGQMNTRGQRGLWRRRQDASLELDFHDDRHCRWCDRKFADIEDAMTQDFEVSQVA